MVSKSGGENGKGIIDKIGLISCWSEGDRGLYYPFSFGPWGDFLVIGTGVCFYSCKFKWLIGKEIMCKARQIGKRDLNFDQIQG